MAVRKKLIIAGIAFAVCCAIGVIIALAVFNAGRSFEFEGHRLKFVSRTETELIMRDEGDNTLSYAKMDGGELLTYIDIAYLRSPKVVPTEREQQLLDRVKKVWENT